jgi:hypothetical protein
VAATSVTIMICEDLAARFLGGARIGAGDLGLALS